MEPTTVTLENAAERLAALEYMLENILPMLIEASPHLPDIRATLQEMLDSPPPKLASSTALQCLVENVLDTIPSAP
ncbi:hypothetical protein [Rhodanobacter sp. OR92]|uniref:hypothetical protein n=1 Tax=Rhodanobacter sp. OR92 TaxID=1076524 RepID=UPI0003FFCCAA|nr:hypothetical protein [Rhodanobacter sp. OR92]